VLEALVRSSKTVKLLHNYPNPIFALTKIRVEINF
jgi:hypothetical protein